MGLDLHIAASNQEIDALALSLSVSEHDSIFHNPKHPLHRAPLLNRMADYYKDADFHGRELPLILNEIDSVIANTTDRQAKGTLQALRKVFQEAHATNAAVYCLCD